MSLLLLALLLPARAETLELELLRPDGRSFSMKRVEQPQDGQQIVFPDGNRAWSARLHRRDYDGRLELCADLSAWNPDGEEEPETSSCVVLIGRESPEASIVIKGRRIQVRMTARR